MRGEACLNMPERKFRIGDDHFLVIELERAGFAVQDMTVHSPCHSNGRSGRSVVASSTARCCAAVFSYGHVPRTHSLSPGPKVVSPDSTLTGSRRSASCNESKSGVSATRPGTTRTRTVLAAGSRCNFPFGEPIDEGPAVQHRRHGRIVRQHFYESNRESCTTSLWKIRLVVLSI